MNAPQSPDELDPAGIVDRARRDHAGRAADYLLAIVRTRDPRYPVNAETHDAAAALVLAVASALAAGGAR